jgi:AbrB family looped-hinge helix DNA binding protein
MSPPQSKVTARGQTTVPAEVRRKLGIVQGSVLEWDDDGENVVMRSVGKYSFEDIHRAVFAKHPKTRTLDELKQGIGRYIREKHARR